MKGDGLRALAISAATMHAGALPAYVLEKAKACLLYGIGVGIAGMRAGQPAKAARASPGGTAGTATRLIDGVKCDAGIAAFANATLFHARVQDDAHPAGHVGVVVIPTALAMAEGTAASGADLVAALVAGYETALRIGRDHASASSARGFRTTPLYGVFGAAATAARLVAADGVRMLHALALAANAAGGLREYAEAGSEDYAYQAGTAAQNGIAAARLAMAGATAATSALDGAAGFFRAYGDNGQHAASRIALQLGEAFEMMDVTYKPYPICQFHRGIVRGCAELRQRSGTALEALTIRMHPFEADFYGVRFSGPFTTFPQTFMSAPFCAALAWSRGDVTLAGLTDFRAEQVLTLVPRVAVVADRTRPRYAPRLEARLASGHVLEWEERDGEASYLLTWDAARRMTMALGVEAGLGARDVERMITEVERLDSAASVVGLFDAIGAACDTARSLVGGPHGGSPTAACRPSVSQ